MARRIVLTAAQRAALLALPSEHAELAGFWNLGDADLAFLGRRRRDRDRLGMALQLCALRYPGRLLRPGEAIPPAAASFVAGQLGVTPGALGSYAAREPTRYEHSSTLQQAFGFRPFEGAARREIEPWLEVTATEALGGFDLATRLRDELRRRQVIMPAITTVERLCAAALTRSERVLAGHLAGDLSREQAQRLEALLEPRPAERLSWLGWLRRPAGAASAAGYRDIVARLGHLRGIGIEPERARRIPGHRLSRLAAEGERLALGHLHGLATLRRRAILVATALELGPRLTDDAFDLHDRLVGRMFRRAERRQAEALALDRRLIGRTVRSLATAGQALLGARLAKTSLDEAVEASLGWDRFAAAVADARRLASRHGQDLAGQLEDGHRPVRQCLPIMLATFELRGVPAALPLMAALDHLRADTQAGRRRLRPDAPTVFVPERWRPFVLQDGGIDRRHYELCAMAELRAALRSGDVWVEGSRRYRSVDDEPVPAAEVDTPRFASRRLDGAPDRQLAAWRARLEQGFAETERLAAAAGLPDAAIKQGRLVISPLRADTPAEALRLHETLYGLLPRVRITELLQEVESWTAFGQDFTHLKTGLPAAEPRTLLTAVLADGINLGLRRMAEACRGASVWQLARVVGWHVREETYALATARLVDAQRQLALARLWGEGTSSSSDGQFFRAGGFGEAGADANARYGQDPGVSFYSHISDQFGAFHTKVIAATAHEAPHVLDGLLQHRTSLRIEEHHTDTAGFTDHVFGLCALLGFRFAPRIRDLPDKRLYMLGDVATWPTLKPLIARKLQPARITAAWPELRRLVASTASGVTAPSHILKRLAAFPRQGRLAAGLREVGRVERTLFILDWLRGPELRRRVQNGLNKGEARNALARAVFFNRLGQIRDRTHENQHHRARGLNLLIAAIVLWNSRYLEHAVAQLRARGHTVDDRLLAHVWPLGWEHINLTGDYSWGTDQPAGPATLRELRLDELPPPAPLTA